MPFFVESLKIEPYEYYSSNSNSTSASSSSHVPKKVVPLENSKITSTKRCRTLSRRMFQKYVEKFSNSNTHESLTIYSLQYLLCKLLEIQVISCSYFYNDLLN